MFDGTGSDANATPEVVQIAHFHQFSMAAPLFSDTFFSGNNVARFLYFGSNDLSFQAESNDTHHDGHFKIFGSRLAPSSPTCIKMRQNVENLGVFKVKNGDAHLFL